jgi:hypothetical protein
MGLSELKRGVEPKFQSRNGTASHVEDEEKTDRAWLLGRLLLNAIRDAVEEAVGKELRRCQEASESEAKPDPNDKKTTN